MIVLSCLFLVLLLFFPEISFAGSKYGCTLWLTQLLPSLLPFFIGIRLFNLGLPKVSSRRFFLLTGLLCGYPAGAALVTGQYQRGLLPIRKAYFYLGFVNNPSPMFILVFCGKNILGISQREAVICLILLIAASLIGSTLFQWLYRYPHGTDNYSLPQQSSSGQTTSISTTEQYLPGFSEQLDEIILDSFVLMIKIGGYVILFSILGQCIHHILPDTSTSNALARILCSGCLEITSGISYLQTSGLSMIAKKILTVTLLAFGGLSAAAQTNSILAKSGLSLLPYVLNKGFNAILALFLSTLWFFIFR